MKTQLEKINKIYRIREYNSIYQLDEIEFLNKAKRIDTKHKIENYVSIIFLV
jgi:hypothetical protein